MNGGLALLLGVGAAGILAWVMLRKETRWNIGDELYIWVEEEGKWGMFTILDISGEMYLVGEGWPPNIIDQNWLPIADIDALPAYRR